MEVIYEITVRIDADIIEEFDAWLERHVAELLALPGFTSAEILAIENEEDEAAQVGRVIHYRLENRAALDAYFRDHAARMREDALSRYGGRFQISRRILHPKS